MLHGLGGKDLGKLLGVAERKRIARSAYLDHVAFPHPAVIGELGRVHDVTETQALLARIGAHVGIVVEVVQQLAHAVDIGLRIVGFETYHADLGVVEHSVGNEYGAYALERLFSAM